MFLEGPFERPRKRERGIGKIPDIAMGRLRKKVGKNPKWTTNHWKRLKGKNREGKKTSKTSQKKAIFHEDFEDIQKYSKIQ